MESPKPAPLKALTGLRCFAAINIVLFHFSNPDWFGWLAPVVNAGYASVSFFILLSGFVLAYNYAARARAGQFDTIRFCKARFTRLYPIYLLSLLLAWRVLPQEWASHTHGMFWAGMVLTPLLLQGWIPGDRDLPEYAGVDHVRRVVLLRDFSVDGAMEAAGRSQGSSAGSWRSCGSIGSDSRDTLHAFQARRHCAPEPLELRPLAAGAQIHAAAAPGQLHLRRSCWQVLDAVMPQAGLAAAAARGLRFWRRCSAVLASGVMPYPLLHDGLLMPFFGCIILGLAGENPLARVIGARPLVFVGEASYCLYLLHFNMWNLIHDTHVLDRVGLNRFDPWISYVLLILMALLALHLWRSRRSGNCANGCMRLVVDACETQVRRQKSPAVVAGLLVSDSDSVLRSD